MSVRLWLIFCGALVACGGGPEKRPVDLQIAASPDAMCTDRVWNQPWSQADQCTTCVQEVEACVARFGEVYCADSCHACLGESACGDRANVSLAARHVKAAQIAGGTSLWAFQGLANSRLIAQDGHYLSQITSGYVIGNLHGALWRLPYDAENECQKAVLDMPWVYRICGEWVERYEAASGFQVESIKLPVPWEEPEFIRMRGELSFDVAGKQMLVRTTSGAKIFEDGKEIATFPGAAEVVRMGPTWNDRNVLYEDRLERFVAGKLEETIPVQSASPMKQNMFHQRFVRLFRGKDAFYLDLWTGAQTPASNDDDPWLSSEAIFARTDIDDRPLRQLAPMAMNFQGFPTTFSGVATRTTSTRLWSGAISSLWMDEQERLFGAIHARNMEESEVSFGVEFRRGEVHSASTRHGEPLWIAPVFGHNAVWVGSVDGIVQRWDFATGTAFRAEIPYRFAAGGGHSVGSHGLVLVEQTLYKDNTSIPARAVMIYQPDKSPVVLEFKETVVDAVLADSKTLVVATPDAIVWWDVATQREVRREPGSGRFSEDGSTVVIFEPLSTFDPGEPEPARIMRTIGSKKPIITQPVRTCAISPNGEKVMCFEVKGKSSEGNYRFYDAVAGVMIEEFGGMLSGEVGQLKPDGDGFLFGGMFNTHWRSVETLGGDRRSAGPDAIFWGFMEDGRVIATQRDRLMVE